MKQERKKKLFAATACAAALAVAAVSGTLAYLTDADADVNVMTLDNVQIAQHEYQRAEGVASDATASKNEGTLVPFEQGQTLYPAVPTGDSPYTAAQAKDGCFKWGDYVTAEDTWNGLWDDSKLANVMDKMVFVENTGKADAYIRTIIAYECPEGMTVGDAGSGDDIGLNTNALWEENYVGSIKVNDVRYVVCEYYYEKDNGVLAAGATARPSLLQVVMNHELDNEDVAKFGDTYEIFVLSQAVQTTGFTNAKDALNAGFGVVNTEKVVKWFAEQNMTVTNKGKIFSEAGVYNITSAIIFEDEADDNIIASAEDVVVNVNGGYYDTGSNRNNCAVWAKDGGTVNINDGYFIADGDAAPATSASHLDLIYAGQGGTINIYGGTFQIRNNNGWILNEKDGTATITVYGGSFLNWNPASNESEGANTSFLAEGYEVQTEEVEGEGTWYHVVKAS